MNAQRGKRRQDDVRVKREIGKRIKRRREELELSQTGLGKLIPTAKGTPTSATQISKWERGINLPEPWKWPTVAAALRMESAQLFGGLEEETPDWVLDLEGRVGKLEAQLGAVVRALRLENVIAADLHRPPTSEGAELVEGILDEARSRPDVSEDLHRAAEQLAELLGVQSLPSR